MKLLAVNPPLGTLEGLGPLGKIKDTVDAFTKFSGVLSIGIGILTISAGIWFIVQIFAGSFQWLTSGGEKQALQNAQKRITNACVGLFVVIFAYALISIIGQVLGFNPLNPFFSLFGLTVPSGGGTPFEMVNPADCINGC